MDQQARAAFIISQALCAQAEIEAMKVANQIRKNEGYPPSYAVDDFMAVPLKYGLDHNAVITYLRD